MFIINTGDIMEYLEKEITVKLKWSLDETKLYFVNAGIPLNESFIIKDTYLIKDSIDINKEKSLDVLSSCIILRECTANNNIIDRACIYKNKQYDQAGNIISCYKYKCKIENPNTMYNILTKTGYRECFRYEQECLEYSYKNNNILLQYVPEIGLFMEIEDNNKSIDELIDELNSLKIPYYENTYFVKKAELMLNTVKKEKKVR